MKSQDHAPCLRPALHHQQLDYRRPSDDIGASLRCYAPDLREAKRH